MSDASIFQQTLSLLQLRLGLIMYLHLICSYVRHNALSCWCCSRRCIILQNLYSRTFWGKKTNKKTSDLREGIKTAHFSLVKASKVNTATGSPVTRETIRQSFPSSSLDLQFTISLFFFFFSRIFNPDNVSDCLGVRGGKFPCGPNARAWRDNPAID